MVFLFRGAPWAVGHPPKPRAEYNLRGAHGNHVVGVSSKNKSGARARGLLFIFYFVLSFKVSLCLFRHTSPKKKKKGDTRQSGCARKPQRFFVAFNVAQLGRPPKMTEN